MKLLKCKRCKRDFHWSEMSSLNTIKDIKDALEDEIYCDGCKYHVNRPYIESINKKDRGKIGWPKKI